MKRERLAGFLIVMVGAALRLYRLPLCPLHNDEGVNGNFMLTLFRTGVYRYDPANYHGPSLYYLDLPLLKALGVTTFALRLETALFGIGLMVLLLILGRRLGRYSGLAAAALVAVSPGMVYFSRYFIHEMLVAFFTVGMVTALVLYGERPGLGRLLAAAAAAGFLFATKESALPTVAVLLLCAWGTRLLMGRPARRKRAEPEKVWPHRDPANVAMAVFVFLAVNIFLYTSFYTNLHGVVDAFHSLAFWSSTVGTGQTHPFGEYLSWMTREDGGILFLGLAASAAALARRTSALAVFCALWSIGLLLMFSVVPYKTPWLVVNLLAPLALVAGWGVEAMVSRSVGLVLLGAALVLGAGQSVSLNFVHYDDNDYAYVYAHTVRDVLRLVGDVEALAGRARGRQTSIAVVSENYWPLPWYLRDYPRAGYFGKVAPHTDAAIAIASPAQEAEMRKVEGGRLRPVGRYVLRPGVDLVLWARPELGKP